MPNKSIKEEKIVPIKNYIVLGSIIVVTMLACVYLFSWYKQYNDSQVTNPVITSTIREVGYDNLDTVLTERDMLIVYMCTTDESICRSFEKKFASYVKENNLTEEIVYLNLGSNSDDNNRLSTIYDKYKSKTLVKHIHKYPALFIFNNGQLVDVLSTKDKSKLTIKQVDEFLEGYDL